MTLEQVGILLSCVVSSFSILSFVYFLSGRFARLELKTETLWDFMWRRAQSEAVIGGFATLNSPIVFHPDSLAAIAPMVEALQSFYKGFGREIKDRDLALLIEREFGERIFKEVCVQAKMYLGACLLMAVQVAKGAHEVEI